MSLRDDDDDIILYIISRVCGKSLLTVLFIILVWLIVDCVVRASCALCVSQRAEPLFLAIPGSWKEGPSLQY